MDVTGRLRADTLQRPHTAALTMSLPTVHDNGGGVALFPQTLHHHHHHHNNRRRRLFGSSDGDGNNNNNSVDRSPTYIDNTTLLVDELEGLRSDNFQLRLRVYNAEQRVDELTAAADEATWCCRRCGGRSRVASFSTESDAGTSETGSVDDDGESTSTAAAEKAAAMASMAKSAVRTISDLMTVNQRLIALLNAVLSAKPVSKSDEDDRRWQTLRNQIKQYCDVSSLALQGAAGVRPQYDQEDFEGYDEDDEDYEDTDSEDESTEPIIVEEREAAPATTATITTTAATGVATGTYTVATSTAVTTNDDGGVDDEVVRLRARCQHLELSIQQLVNTELWARNRQIGKLEQQRCAMAAAQQQQQRQQHRDDTATSTAQRSSRPPATSTPVPKGILVQRPCRPHTLSSSDARPEARAGGGGGGPTMKSPPPVLPDYSEVNFFFSCDEEDDLHLSHRRETDAAPWSSSSSSRASDDGTGSEDEKPANNNNNNNHDRPPRRRLSFRRGYRHKHLNSTVRAESATPAAAAAAPLAVADAQVQCDQVSSQDADDDRQAQQQLVQQLRRELDARRRENSRLYEMLLKLQRDKERTGVTPSPSPPRDTASSSPEPYGRAARDVRSRIADLLPPLLTRTTAAGGGGSSPGSAACSPPRDDGRPAPEQQQQMNALDRLRDRIVEYERQVLSGKEDAGAGPEAAVVVDSDAENAEVRRMDRADLVNVALPRVVDRFRRVLQVQQQQQQRPAHVVQEPTFGSETSTESGECNLRRRRTPNRT